MHPQRGSLASESHESAEDALQMHLVRSITSLHMLWVAFHLVLGLISQVYMFRNYHLLSSDGPFWEGFLKVFLICLFFKLRVILIFLAPLINDMAFTRVAVIWDILVVFGVKLTTLSKEGFGVQREQAEQVVLIAMYVRFLFFVAFGIWALHTESPSEAQSRWWRGLGTMTAIDIAQWSLWVLHVAVQQQRLTYHVGNILSSIPVLYIALRPQLRRQFQEQVMRWITAQVSPSGIARLICLTGALPAGEMMSVFGRRFTCVHHSQVELDRSPRSPAAKPPAFATVDAFVSHCWRDDERARWAALQAWGADFVARRGREALLWLDKGGIDERGADMDLQYLPIFPQGCSRLVVLCGPTYLSCLWCILEIFTHVRTSGSTGSIELVQVLRAGFELDDARAIQSAFDRFDARDCQCFDPGDTQRVLATVGAVCGSLDEFNESMKGIIENMREQLGGIPRVACAAQGAVAEVV